MAFKLPSFADLPSNDPSAVGGLPNFPANDPGAAGLAVLGKGVSDVGNAALDVAAERQRKNNQINAALADASLDGDLIRTSEALKHERDPAKIDELKGQLSGHLDRAAATITDPDARQLWAAKHRAKIVATEAVADSQHRKVYNDRFLAGASQQLDEQARLAAQASEPAQREQAQRNIGNILGSLEANGIIDATKGQTLASSYGEKVIIGTVNWLDANKDPIGASRFLRENLRHIDPDKAESLTRHLRPLEDREIGRAAANRYRPGAGGAISDPRGLVPYIREQAAVNGIDPDTAVAVARSEGLAVFSGDGGKSGGAFQLYTGGGVGNRFQADTGLDPLDPKNEKQTIDYALKTAAKEGWGAWNGAKRIGITGFRGIGGAKLAGDPSGVIDENTDPALSAKIDAAPPGGLPIPLDRPGAEPAPALGVPDIRAWVDRIKADKTLTEEQKDIAIREVQQDQQQTMLGHAQAESDLSLAIARGEKGRADIEDAYRAQRISPEKRTALNHAIDKIEEQQNALAQGVAKVSAAGNGGAPLDPKSKDDRAYLNFHYDAVSKAWPADQAVDRGLAYSAQYGMVPTALQARIRGGLHSGRPELAIESTRTINRLRNANPQLVGEIDDENDLRLAALISSYDSDGVSPERAMQMAVDRLKVSKAEREARAEDFDAQRGKTAVERRTADTTWIEKQQNSLWVRDPNVDPMMRHEFEVVAKAEFEKTGNLEASRRMSLDNINRVWGRSRVGGDLRYMKDAPEKFYGVPALSESENGAWMKEQLAADVAKGAFVDPANPITADRIKLLPDSTRAQGGAPVYQVWLAKPDGSWQQVIKPDGTPIAWKPDWASSEGFKKQQAEKQYLIDVARGLRSPTPAEEKLRDTDAGRLLEEVR